MQASVFHGKDGVFVFFPSWGLVRNRRFANQRAEPTNGRFANRPYKSTTGGHRMKIAFPPWAAPTSAGWTSTQWPGLPLRRHRDPRPGPEHPGRHRVAVHRAADRQDEAKRASLHLEIPCLSSGCCLKFPERGTRCWRKSGSTWTWPRGWAALYPHPGRPGPGPAGEVDDDTCRAVVELADMARPAGVTLLVETTASTRTRSGWRG